MDSHELPNSTHNPERASYADKNLPEYALICKVMELAVQDATDARNSDKRNVAWSWLFEDHPAEFSAGWVADMMGLDIEVIRQNIRSRGGQVHRALSQSHRASTRPRTDELGAPE